MTYRSLALRDRRDASKLAELDTRGRAAYLEGAEEWSRQTHGRGLAGEGLERVIRRFPGRR